MTRATGHRVDPILVGPSVGQLLATASRRLSREVDAARLEAEALLGHCLGRPRSWIFAHAEYIPSPEEQRRFDLLVTRRCNGEPLAYLTGEREFWSLSLAVGPETLIPRPETEGIVELALAHLPAATCRVADLGTGSGAIALALAHERPGWEITASDISPAAIDLARANAERLGLSHVRFRVGEWCKALDTGPYDLIAANPPYVAVHDEAIAAGVAAHEPHLALFSGPTGLECLDRIAHDARRYLKDGGLLLLEHGHDQGVALRHRLHCLGYRDIDQHNDLYGHERIVSACWRKS